MSTIVVLPCVVVNWIILINSLSQKKIAICCLSQNCRLKLGFCCCVCNYGMIMCRFLEVHPTRTESINVACNKIKEHVWPCVLKMIIKNLQWKHILIINKLATLFAISLPSNVSFARFAWKIKTFFLITKWWTNALLTRGRSYWRCTWLGTSMKQWK
jgi:hypothetical protein